MHRMTAGLTRLVSSDASCASDRAEARKRAKDDDELASTHKLQQNCAHKKSSALTVKAPP